jgi:hypothetical protein
MTSRINENLIYRIIVNGIARKVAVCYVSFEAGSKERLGRTGHTVLKDAQIDEWVIGARSPS